VVAATALGLFASRDAGETWQAVGGVPGRHRIERLAFLPAGDRLLLAATDGGLLASSDFGRSWAVLGRGLPRRSITGLALHPGGRRLYATAARDGRLYRSDDAGGTWRGFALDVAGRQRLRPLAVDPANPGRLLAASTPVGLFAIELDALSVEAEPPAPSPADARPTSGQQEH
jgi:photosystem II stability/assembly factor-like uncharacterized protein